MFLLNRVQAFKNVRQILKQGGCAALLAALSLTSLGLPAVAATQKVAVTVDFGMNNPKKNMSGFLHGIGGVNPPDALLAPLKPALWRIRAGDNVTYRRATNAGAQIEVVLSDGYGTPSNGWKGRGAPWENNWTHWESFVRQMAQMYSNTPVYWDVWNEPDVKEWNKTQFWNGTQAQFFETYKRAYTILRQELGPNAMIGGPSFANYEPLNTQAFLEYCHANGLQVNFLSWHELMLAETNIPAVANHIGTLRALAATYPDLATQKIFINESVGPKTQYYPGDILGFLYNLERGGADGANKGCWGDSHGKNNCSNQSLDGIINPDYEASTPNPQPRAGWWAYKTYADGIESRVKTTSSSLNLVALASRNPAQVLLGYFGLSMKDPAEVTLTLQHLNWVGQKGNAVQLTIAKAPNAGEASVTSLEPVLTTTVPVLNETAVVMIPAMNVHEEYVIYVSPAP